MSISPKLKPFMNNFERNLKRAKEQGVENTPQVFRSNYLYNITPYFREFPTISYLKDKEVKTRAGKVKVHIYSPSTMKNLPVLMFYHGGGFICGDLDAYDVIATRLAKITDHIVVSVEYRLAPENPYPTGLEDCYDALLNIGSVLEEDLQPDMTRISVSGDGAGGGLAATVSSWASLYKTIKIKKQLLFYPNLDYTMSLPSMEKYGTGFYFENSRMQWYLDNYFPKDANRKEASPLWGDFEGLPETLVISGEFDPLYDEGKLYIARLHRSNILGEFLEVSGMIHNFLNLELFVWEECELVYKATKNFLSLYED